MQMVKKLIQSNDVVCLRPWKCNLTFEMENHQSLPSNIVFLWILELLCINEWLCWHTQYRVVLRSISPTLLCKTHICTCIAFAIKGAIKLWLILLTNRARFYAQLLESVFYAICQKNILALKLCIKILVKLTPDDWFSCCCTFVKHVPNQMHDRL